MVKRIVFSGHVDSIEYVKWAWCGNPLPHLSEVVLPETLKRLGSKVFQNTPLLAEIRIPPEVEEIGEGAFKDDSGHTKVLLVDKGSRAEAVVKAFVAERSDLEYRVLLSPEQQKQLDEENRLKRLASELKQKLLAAYRSDLASEQCDALKAEMEAMIGAACSRADWCAIRKLNIQPIPISLAPTAVSCVESAESAESVYDNLPAWIAADYIAYAEKKAAELAALTEKRDRTIAGLNTEAAALKEELSHLGIFKGKRKKEIAVLLTEIDAKIRQAEEDYKKNLQ